LYYRAYQRLVVAARQRDLPLRQNYNRNAKQLLAQQSLYAKSIIWGRRLPKNSSLINSVMNVYFEYNHY